MSQQLLFLPVAAASQLYFVGQVAQNLNSSDYSRTLLIMNLSTLVSFLDFGLLYSFFYFATSHNEHSSFNMAIKRKFSILTLKVATTEIICGLFLINSAVYRTLGIYVIIFAINLPGLMGLIELRAKGRDFLYLILFNLSWPISAISVHLVGKFNFYVIDKNIGYLPIIASTFINTSFLVLNWKKSMFSSIFSRSKSSLVKDIGLKAFITQSFFYTSLFAVVSQSDKYLANSITSGKDLALYLTYSQIFTSLLAVLNLAYLNISRSPNLNQSEKINFRFLPSISAAIVFAILSFFFVDIFYPLWKNSSILLILGSINLFLYGYLLSINANLIAKGMPNHRLPGVIIQGIAILIMYAVAHSNESLVLLQIGVGISIAANIIVGEILHRGLLRDDAIRQLK